MTSTRGIRSGAALPILILLGTAIGVLTILLPWPYPVVLLTLLLAGLSLYLLDLLWPQSAILLMLVGVYTNHYRWDVKSVSIRTEQMIAVLLAAWLVVRLARDRRLPRFTIASAMAMGWLAVNFVASLVHSPAATECLKNSVRLSVMVLIYILVINLIESRKEWFFTLRLYLWLGIMEAAFGILALALYLGMHVRIGVQLKWYQVAPIPYGTMEVGDIFGGQMAALWVMFLILFLQGRLRDRSRPFLTLGLVTTGIALVLSLARTAWLVAIAGTLVVLLAYHPDAKTRVRQAMRYLIYLPVALLALILVIQVLPPSIPFVARLHTFGKITEDSTVQWRLVSIRMALDDWSKSPWIGWGPGSFFPMHGYIYWSPAWVSVQLISLLQSVGVFGLTFYLLFMGSILVTATGALKRIEERHWRILLLAVVFGLLALWADSQASDATWLGMLWFTAGMAESGGWALVSRRRSS